MFAYVIRSNYLHLVIQTAVGIELSDILRDFKKFTAIQIMKQIQEEVGESRREWLMYMFKHFAIKNKTGQDYQFWTHDNHPIVLYSPSVVSQKIAYIHNNPVRAGIVELPEAYIFSSAVYYVTGEQGVLDVEAPEELFGM